LNFRPEFPEYITGGLGNAGEIGRRRLSDIGHFAFDNILRHSNWFNGEENQVH
jgi:hypothetical protein